MNTAQDRGWGPGWPDCQRDRCLNVEAAGVRWLVRQEVADLTVALARAWHATVEALDPAQCWSFACRAIRSSTTTASNHSWGLALDFNSAKHPLGAAGTFSAAQVRAIRALLARPEFRHFRWGGDFSRPDEMHVEYVGTVADAAHDTRLLHNPEDDDMPLTDAEKDDIAGRTAALLKAEFATVNRNLGTVRGNDGAEDKDPTHGSVNDVLREVQALREEFAALRASGGGPAAYEITGTLTPKVSG